MGRTLAVVLSVAAASAFAQSNNPMRDAYPICFEAYPDESSAEHAKCIELSARFASTGWTRPGLEEAVHRELAKEKEAAAAEEKLRALRSAAERELNARASDPSALEFKGIAIGLDLATIEATGRYRCSDPRSPIADRACNLNYNDSETIAGAPVEDLSLFFYDNKLENISITFPEEHFNTVISALTEKYGVAQIKTEIVQNRMGASFENKTLTWKKGAGTIQARRYAGKLDRSAVQYLSPTYLKNFAARRKMSTRRGAKDL